MDFANESEGNQAKREQVSFCVLYLGFQNKVWLRSTSKDLGIGIFSLFKDLDLEVDFPFWNTQLCIYGAPPSNSFHQSSGNPKEEDEERV